MIDLHTHSTASDGRTSPGDLMWEAKGAGISVLGLTDHDTVAGWAEAAARVSMLADAALADGYVEDVAVSRTAIDGVPVVRAEVTAPLPVLGLLGPSGALRVTGHAVDEAALVRRASGAREEP